MMKITYKYMPVIDLVKNLITPEKLSELLQTLDQIEEECEQEVELEETK